MVRTRDNQKKRKKPRISVQSAKAKARRLQNWVAERVGELLGMPWGYDEMIAPREMGQSGVDVRLVGEALEKFPWSIECFSKNTLIVTREGLKPIQDIKIGDKVYTHKGRFRKVLNIFQQEKDVICNLKSNISIEEIKTTCNHPFESFDKKFINAIDIDYLSQIFIKDNGYDINKKILKISKDFIKDKFINKYSRYCACGCGTIIDRYDNKKRERRFKAGHSGKIPNVKNIVDFVEIDHDLMTIFGWYIAEGHLSESSVHFTLSSQEIKEAKLIKELCEKKFEIKCNLYIRKSVCHINIYSIILKKFFSDIFGTGSKNKKIGEFLFYKKQLLQSLIIAYFMGDGYIDIKNGVAECDTVSRLLAYEIQFALLRLGIHSRIYKLNNKIYKINVSKSSLKRFYILMDNGNYRYEKFEINHDDNGHIYDFINGRIYTKIDKRKIINKKESEIVYNLEVEEDNTYIIQGGIIVHNCKNQESWSVHSWIEQAQKNVIPGTQWLLVCSRNNKKPVVILDGEVFFQLLILKRGKKGL